MATENYQLLIDTRGASQAGPTYNTSGQQTFTCFQVIVDATVADLVGDVVFTCGNEDSASLGTVFNWATTVTNVPSGWTLTANPTLPTGHIHFGSPGVGTSSLIVRTNFGARLFRPTFTFTSGTDSPRVRVYGWGAKIGGN